MMKKSLILAPLAAILLAGTPARPVRAASGTGTSAAQFLKIGASARAAAMAEAQVALTDDIYAPYYNPAGLALVESPVMGATHTQYVLEAGYQYGALALPLEGGAGTLGLSISNLGVPDLERRTQDTDLPVGYFDASNFAYALSYGRRLNDRLCAGLSGKVVTVTIDEVSGSALAMDAGLRYEPDLPLAFPVYAAVAVRNFGSKLKLGGSSDPLPSAVVAGLAARPRGDTAVTLDFIRYRDSGLQVAVGGEYTHSLSARLDGTLRAGYSNHRRDLDGNSMVTLGAGLALQSISFDFAWVPYGDLGNTFRYSMMLRF